MSGEATVEQTMLNGSLTETTADTIKVANIEVPGSEGATRVVLIEAKLMTDVPVVPASGASVCGALILVGKKTPTIALLNQEDAVECDWTWLFSDGGTPAKPVVVHTFSSGELGSPVEVPKVASSSKFYVTVAVQSVACSTTLSCYYHMRFLITRA